MNRRPQPSGFGRPPGVAPPVVPDPLDRVARMLEDYARATAIGPRADLTRRIAYRVAKEPRSTAPRRFLTALMALDARAAGRGLAQSLHTIIEPEPRSAWPRLQAAALVLVVFVSLSAGVVVGLAGAEAMISRLTQGPSDNAAAPLLPASPSPSPSLPSFIERSDPVPSRTEPPEVKKPRAQATPRAPAQARSTSAPRKSSVKSGTRPRAEERLERDEDRKGTPEPTEPPDDDHDEADREDEGSS